MTVHPNLLRLSAAAGARTAAEDRFRLALVVAFDGRAGAYNVEKIAEAAGVSRARVYQIIDDARVR